MRDDAGAARPALLARVDEADVIAEFLRVEIESPRFGARILARLEADGRDRALLDRPDTSDPAVNAYRAQLLHGYRGVGGSAPLLESLPEEIGWWRAALDRAALEHVRYMDYPYWNELSAGTRSPVVAAKRIRDGVTAMGRPNDAFVAVAERLCAGESLGMPMLVAAAREEAPIVLEGHTRVTAMLLRPECLPDRVEAFVGYAAGIRDWMYYGAPAGEAHNA